jgi:hypothetical protein
VKSVTTRSPKAARATVTLTYLATGYDWTASYVARVADDGRTLDLFAWMTVANGNSATYPDASLMAIAGEPNIESDFDGLADVPDTPVLSLRCFPTGSGRGGIPRYVPPPPSAPPAPMMAYAGEGLDIIVTAQKRSASMADAAVAIAAIAEQEGLGDLKLYRVPVPVTVAANAQKQVALLVKDKVPFERIHRLRMSPGSEDEMETTTIVRMVNKEKDRLGIPLPSGQVAVFERALGERLLAGNGQLRDHAVGETVNLEIGESSQVQVREENYVAPYEDDGDRYRLTVSNANPFPVKVEIGFYDTDDDYRIVDRKLRKLPRKDGLPTWIVTVPANSEEKLYYRVRDRD